MARVKEWAFGEPMKDKEIKKSFAATVCMEHTGHAVLKVSHIYQNRIDFTIRVDDKVYNVGVSVKEFLAFLEEIKAQQTINKILELGKEMECGAQEKQR